MKRRQTQKVSVIPCVEDVAAILEQIAPVRLAQDWDNVGLLAGDRSARVRRILLCIDLTREVLVEARKKRIELLVAYHPPIFKPVRSVTFPGSAMDALVFECIRAGIAIYSPHTALDAANGGTNDVLAQLCEPRMIEPFGSPDKSGPARFKIVVFTPPEHADNVAKAMFDAGAGNIGDYSHCSFRVPGEGSFLGGRTTNPTVGQRGRLERVNESRLETTAPQHRLTAILSAMHEAHPYEEPAFDVYAVYTPPEGGVGRIAILNEPRQLAELAGTLTKATRASGAQLVGNARSSVSRAIVVAGSAGSLPFRIPLSPRDVIVTGEIRHHDALAIQRHDCSAIALGHWTSERPVLSQLRKRLAAELDHVKVAMSDADRDPFVSMTRRKA